MIAIPISTVQQVITDMDKTLKKQKAALQRRLHHQRKTLTAPRHQKYFDYLISLKGEIIVAQPVQLAHIRRKLQRIVGPKNMQLPANDLLRTALEKAFGYTALRSHFYPEYFQRLGIKTCIYCNACILWRC